jgi:hypothetical protein
MTTKTFLAIAVFSGLVSAGSAITTLAATKKPLHAVPSTESKMSKCSFGAFVTETDPTGLNVRVLPSLQGKIIGTLPPVVASSELDNYMVKVEVDILASNNGWFQITNAQENAALTGKAARPAFKGTGWVSGRKLTVKSQATTGHAQPSQKAAIALRLRNGGSFDSDEMVQSGQLVSCQGNWAQVEFSTEKMSGEMTKEIIFSPAVQPSLPKGHFRAWLDNICAIQETTCDGTASGK